MKRMALVALGAVIVNAQVAFAQPAARDAPQAKQLRYQIGQMERVLEGAVEHGVANIRDRLQALGRPSC